MKKASLNWYFLVHCIIKLKPSFFLPAITVSVASLDTAFPYLFVARHLYKPSSAADKLVKRRVLDTLFAIGTLLWNLQQIKSL